MEQNKRSFSYDNDNNKKQKIKNTTDETSVTVFEDLSNELIYEVFEFFDYFYLYETFSNFNQRFYHLLTFSNLPININCSSISKSTFKRYHQIITPSNIDRIRSLWFSDIFKEEYVFSAFNKISDFQQLKSLLLHNIEYDYLVNLLNQLISLPLLSSLTIISDENIQDKNTIYRQVFRFRALKYCKLSSGGWNGDRLPLCINEYSPIEHLIITEQLFLDSIDNLLSYVPHLCRLSIHAIARSWDQLEEISSVRFNNLINVTLTLVSNSFSPLDKLIVNYFQNVQVLHFTIVRDNIDRAYLDANQWQQLIIFHMPKLRIFDIQIDTLVNENFHYSCIKTILNQFTSSFWIERQWYFTYQYYRTKHKRLRFYSINPYRRTHYTLYKYLKINTDLEHNQSNLDSVRRLRIEHGQSTKYCMHYFPNVTELIFNDVLRHPSIATMLSRLVPLKQLTKLVIADYDFTIQKVIEILCCAPNIHTLKLNSNPYKRLHTYKTLKESENFQLISNTNTIINVICDGEYPLKQIEFLVALCPRMQFLKINYFDKDYESIIRFLLDKTNPNTRHLFSLCFSNIYDQYMNKINTLIESERLLVDYTLKKIDRCLYLRW